MRAVLALGLLLAVVAPAGAEEWSGIVPGASTQAQVRARHGAPTRTTAQKVEGFSTTTWIYEGAQAPVGTQRMTVEFGLKLPSGYQ
ncbi:MAG: hypothetical protein HY216_16465, partial [Candidatus Rokubacteria bacterium]|nr:hypothetical protein [Candidatus Rokubacteria bacterium]